jgi:hypothetical protein
MKEAIGPGRLRRVQAHAVHQQHDALLFQPTQHRVGTLGPVRGHRQAGLAAQGIAQAHARSIQPIALDHLHRRRGVQRAGGVTLGGDLHCGEPGQRPPRLRRWIPCAFRGNSFCCARRVRSRCRDGAAHQQQDRSRHRPQPGHSLLGQRSHTGTGSLEHHTSLIRMIAVIDSIHPSRHVLHDPVQVQWLLLLIRRIPI